MTRTVWIGASAMLLLGLLTAAPAGAQVPASPTNLRILNADLRQLIVSKAGTGSGSVTGPGISCGTDCTELYVVGTTLGLTATASVDHVFVGWSGACSGAGACLVTMNQMQAVTATFNLPQFALNVTNAGTGTGTVAGTGINCGTDCTELYDQGTVVTLTATPSANSTFAWGGACVGTGSCVVSMTQDRSVTATFTQVIWHLTWTDNASDETSYEVERGPAVGGPFGLLATLGINAISYNDDTVTVGTAYCYRVRARNVAGPSGYSNVACTP